MDNLKVAFDILEEGPKRPPGYTPESSHLVFDARTTLERKARWVKDGHRTPEPNQSTYAGLVTRESIRVALTYAALNGLSVFGADIRNSYLQAPTSETHYIKYESKFVIENVGKTAIIVRALYGGKAAGAEYWRHIRKAMNEMDFTLYPDVWIRPSVKDDGSKYNQYVLLYTDDIMCMMENPSEFMEKEIGSRFTLKEKSIGPPKKYLGNKVSQVTLDSGTTCWSLGSSQYVQNDVTNVESYLKRKGEKLPPRAKSPWSNNYRLETDMSLELSSVKAAYFQSLICILRWIVELNRIDIAMETPAMASMMALPREGHLIELYVCSHSLRLDII